jgi:hypothetical protein
MKAINYLLLLIIFSSGPVILNAQSQTMGIKANHVKWDAPICTKIPGKKNRISWTTAQTVPTKTYEVLRSADGINFTIIGSVPAETQNLTTYLFEDVQPIATSFYQICSVSATGIKTYSAKIKAVNSTVSSMVRQGYNSATLVFKDNSPRVITLVNVNGQPLRTASSTDYQYRIDTNNMAKGMYLVKIDIAGSIEVQKIMVL